jgi:hypothetical protein
MSGDATPNLNLIYLDPAQEQPEVKVNDAWNKIDALFGEFTGLTVTAEGVSPHVAVVRATQIRFNGATVVEESNGVAEVTIVAAAAPTTTKGDLAGFDTASKRIPVGSNAQVLTADSTQALGLKWATPVAAPTTTKGDLAGFDTGSNRIPVGSNAQVLTADSTQALGLKWATPAPVVLQLACSDLVTALATATGVAYCRAPCAFTITAVRASLLTASSSGLPTVNIKKNGVTVLSTALSIDATEKTSTTAATPAVISVPAVADDDELSIDITVAGTGAKGLIVSIIGNV